jgi:hypothetical protein
MTFVSNEAAFAWPRRRSVENAASCRIPYFVFKTSKPLGNLAVRT